MLNKQDLLEEIKSLVFNNSNKKFNSNYATPANIKKIADRFTNHKKTNVNSIKGLNKVIQYMISAKIVGDKKLYNELNDMTNNMLDYMCDEIEVEDNCYDNFDTAVERHVYTFNKELYEFLKEHNIKYLDAGILQLNERKYIFIPEYNTSINISTIAALDMAKSMIKKEKDPLYSTNENLIKTDINKFIAKDGNLICNIDGEEYILHLKDDTNVLAYFNDIEEPLNYIPTKITGNAGGNGYINLSIKESINALKNDTTIYVTDGIIYANKTNHIVTIGGGFYKLHHIYVIDNLSSYKLVYRYAGLHESFIDFIDIKSANTGYTISVKDYNQKYNEEIQNRKLYIMKHNIIINSIPYKTASGYARNIEFEDLLKLFEPILYN